MRILPFERFTIESPLGVDELMHRLRQGVAPIRFSFRRPPQPFQGSVHGESFWIYRVIGYRNSFRPQVSGRVVPRHSGSKIEVTMTLHPVVAVFMGIWLTIGTLVFAGLGIAMLRQPNVARDIGFFPFLILPFGLALCTFGFRIEAGRSKRALRQLAGVSAE